MGADKLILFWFCSVLLSVHVIELQRYKKYTRSLDALDQLKP